MGKILNSLKGKVSDQPGIWLMRQAGRYLPEYQVVRSKIGSFMDLCYTPEAAAEVTLQPIRRFNFDASIIFSDILVIPDALGQKVSFLQNHGPKLAPFTKPFLDKLLDRNDNDWSQELEYLEPVFKALKIVRSELPNQTDLIGFCATPWTVATYMIEEGKSQNFSKILKFAKDEQDQFLKLLDILSNLSAYYLMEQIKSGAQILQLFDSWASIAPDEQKENYLFKPALKIMNLVWRQYPDVPIIYYGKGISKHYNNLHSKVDKKYYFGLGVDQSVNLHDFKMLQKMAPVQGNLDPELLVKGGDDCFNTAKDILKTMKDSPFIFNLGHGILPNTPTEHVEKLIEIVRS